MNVNHLKAFVKVVQMNSFKEAAKHLGVSQPAISMRIQALEEHFGAKLITRETEGVHLTSSGEQVYETFQTMLIHLDELERSLSGDTFTGTLKLGASTIPSEYLLPSLLKAFRTEQPGVRTQTAVAGTHTVTKWLLNRSVDAILTGKPEEHHDIASMKVFTDQLKVVAPLHFEDKGPLQLGDLLSYDWILRESHSNTRRVWEQELMERKLLDQLNVVGQMGSTEAIIAGVEAGLGLSVISSLAASRAEACGRIKIIAVPEMNLTRSFYLSILKENEHSPLPSSFFRFVSTFAFES